jgi:hypothetical protein
MNKNVAVVLSYCDTDEKVSILSNLLDELLLHELDICLISPLILSMEIQSKCDYFIHTKDNPILSWPEEYGCHAWMIQSYDDVLFKMNSMGSDYGWTVLYQLKVVGSLLKNIDYENIVLMNYDIDITENPLKFIDNDDSMMFYTWFSFEKKEKDVSPLLLSKWKKSEFLSILNCINKSDYINNCVSPENNLRQIIHSLGIHYIVPEFTLSDLSEYKINSKFDTFSEIDGDVYGFKLFVTNLGEYNSPGLGNFSIWIYDFSRVVNPFDITITLHNDESHTFRIVESKNTLITSEYDTSDIKQCNLIIDNDVVDISDTFNAGKLSLKQFITYV